MRIITSKNYLLITAKANQKLKDILAEGGDLKTKIVLRRFSEIENEQAKKWVKKHKKLDYASTIKRLLLKKDRNFNPEKDFLLVVKCSKKKKANGK